MVRHRLHSTVALGRMNDALDWARQMNEIAGKRGWPVGRVLMPGFGKVNGFIYEREFADFATMERIDMAFYADDEAMKVWRKATDLNAPGSHPWDECEVAAPDHLA